MHEKGPILAAATIATAMTATALVAAVVVALGAAAACGGNNAGPPPQPPKLATSATAAADAAAPSSADLDAGTAPTPPPRLPAPALVLWSPSPDPAAPTPTVRITAPKADELIPTDKALDYPVTLDVKSWQTATGSQHVHLILDNEPYKAIYDTKAPTKLRDLLAGGVPLPDGQHVLVAFPSRANHESVKTPGAIFVTQFWIGAKKAPADGQTPVDLTKPMLVYSRPKGEYKGDQTGHILIDFQLLNTTLAADASVVTIAVKGPGIPDELDARAEKFGPPFYLDNAQNGQYSVTLKLVGKDGAPLPGPWNTTSRTIKIDRNAVPESMPGMQMGGGGDAGAH